MDEETARKRTAAASFDAAADGYRESAVHRAGADLDRLASWCAGADRALDVATGAGHTAAALADAGVPAVVALDVAPGMVAQAGETGDGAALIGVLGDAERLPFADGSFDAVTCRIAAHHFPDPAAFVAEAARVLAPGGTLAIEDNVAPEDPDVAVVLNRVERVRDPTHVRSHPVSRWETWLADTGFAVQEVERVRKRLAYGPWLDRSDVPAERRRVLDALLAAAPDEVVEALAIEADGGKVKSFAPPKALIRAGVRGDSDEG